MIERNFHEVPRSTLQKKDIRERKDPPFKVVNKLTWFLYTTAALGGLVSSAPLDRSLTKHGENALTQNPYLGDHSPKPDGVSLRPDSLHTSDPFKDILPPAEEELWGKSTKVASLNTDSSSEDPNPEKSNSLTKQQDTISPLDTRNHKRDLEANSGKQLRDHNQETEKCVRTMYEMLQKRQNGTSENTYVTESEFSTFVAEINSVLTGLANDIGHVNASTRNYTTQGDVDKALNKYTKWPLVPAVVISTVSGIALPWVVSRAKRRMQRRAEQNEPTEQARRSRSFLNFLRRRLPTPLANRGALPGVTDQPSDEIGSRQDDIPMEPV